MLLKATKRIAALATAAAVSVQPLPALAQQPASVRLEVKANQPGSKISREIFGQFAEHLGSGIYGGIWVGPESPIHNVRECVIGCLFSVYGVRLRHRRARTHRTIVRCFEKCGRGVTPTSRVDGPMTARHPADHHESVVQIEGARNHR